MGWSNLVQVRVVRESEFSLEPMVGSKNGKEQFWAMFCSLSTESKARKKQWRELKARKHLWGRGKKWILGGDLNDIKNQH